jgi:hypothetical protein
MMVQSAGDLDPAWPSRYGRMRVRIIAVTVACLAVVGVSGCAQPDVTCAVKDYGGGGASSYQTPQQALQSVLARHEQWLSATGWKLTDRSVSGATFVASNDSVDVVKNKAGRWNVAGVTACK